MPKRLPSGTVTFLFTDIEGSTGKWERHPAAMAEALPVHDRILRGAIEGHDGRVFKTVGDAFCAAFRRPADAVRAVGAALVELSAHAWEPFGALRVRAGIHTGAAIERDRDYFGPVLNKTARIEAAAHGGQVLLSDEAAALLDGILPGEFSLERLGEFRLKDLTRPQVLHELRGPGLPGGFPRPRTLDRAPNNLPVQPTEFVGRSGELDALARLLASRRLVTITGPGGAGKTRLACRAAAESADAFPDGIYLIELVRRSGDPPGDPAVETVYLDILEALDVRAGAGKPAAETLGDFLRERRTLLVVDNCEHRIDAAALAVEALLARSPGLVVLATSREGLKLPGEALFPLAPFDLPDCTGNDPPASFWKNDCVQFFLARLEECGEGFAVTDAETPRIAGICRRLDGIPLALELAAGKLRGLTIDELAVALEQPLAALDAGRRGGLAHQRTLRSAIAWSVDLLDARERLLLAHLSVFPGEFDRAAVEAVCAVPSLQARDAGRLLTGLVDKSLVATRAVAGTTRYRLLETIREFAAESLDPAEADPLGERFEAHYLTRAGARDPERDEVAYQDAVRLDYPNYRHLLVRLSARLGKEPGAERTAGELAGLSLDLFWFWFVGGDPREGLGWLEAALRVAPADPLHRRIDLLRCVGNLLRERGDFEGAKAKFAEGLALAEGSNDPLRIADLSQSLGVALNDTGSFAEARERLEAGLAGFRALGNRSGESRSLLNLGVYHMRQGELERARDCFKASCDGFEALGEKGRLAIALMDYSLTLMRDDPAGEERAALRARDLFRELRSRGGLALCDHCLASIAQSRGDDAAALDLDRESLAAYYAMGDNARCVSPLDSLARVFLRAGERRRPATIIGALERFLARARLVIFDFEEMAREREKVLAAHVRPAERDAFAAGRAAGGELPLEAAIRLALDPAPHD